MHDNKTQTRKINSSIFVRSSFKHHLISDSIPNTIIIRFDDMDLVLISHYVRHNNIAEITDTVNIICNKITDLMTDNPKIKILFFGDLNRFDYLANCIQQIRLQKLDIGETHRTPVSDSLHELHHIFTLNISLAFQIILESQTLSDHSLVLLNIRRDQKPVCHRLALVNVRAAQKIGEDIALYDWEYINIFYYSNKHRLIKGQKIVKADNKDRL